MNCFTDLKNVEKFLKRNKSYDGRVALILRSYLKKGASVLNIGLNNGKDYEVLGEWYDVVCIESSKFFIDIYNPERKMMQIYHGDDVKLDFNRKFDCIFTNRLINRFTKDELKESLQNQLDLLEADGKSFHLFYEGEGELLLGGVALNLYNQEVLKEIIPSGFEIVKFTKYLLDNRFSYMILKKK